MKPVIIILSLILVGVVFIQCEKEPNISITLKEIIEITPHSVTVNFEVKGDIRSIIQNGFICNLVSDPSIRVVRTFPFETREITFTINGLLPNSTYRLIAYLYTSNGTFWSDKETFTTLEIPGGTLVDQRDENTYKWVEIGNQIWMAENLAYLPSVSPPTAGSGTEPYYYVYGYGGTSVNEAKATDNFYLYGVLYNWPAAMEACPDGWHVPSDEEWSELEDYVLTGGTALKATSGWRNAGNGTDGYGFCALPGGYRNFDYYFKDVGYDGIWWSSTESIYNNNSSWFRKLYHTFSFVYQGYDLKENGFSVRCIKD
jgi:uncharacterized protein (TIGR02145 family)